MVMLNAGDRGISAAIIAQTEEAGSKASPAEGLAVAVTTARRYVMAMMSYAASGPLCSFCQRPRAEVLSLVDGGTVRICSDSQPSPPNRSSAARSVSGSPRKTPRTEIELALRRAKQIR
jgi:ClpX C4-type zinc finger